MVKRSFSKSKIVYMSASTILSGCVFAHPAFAQLTSTIPDIQTVESVDSNGVDLVTGKFGYQIATLDFGPNTQSRLKWAVRVGDTTKRITDNFTGRIELTTEGGQSYVYAIRGSSAKKFRNVSGVYTPVFSDGTNLSYNGANKTWTLTDRDGVKVEYYQRIETGDSLCPGNTNVSYIKSIKYTDGEILEFKFRERKDITDPEGPNCKLRIEYRMQSATSNFGYQLKFKYLSNTKPGPTSPSDAFVRIVSVTSLNRAVDYCDPSADSCSYSKPWPSLEITQNAASNPASTERYFKDSLGRTWTFGYSGSTRSIKAPTSSIPVITANYDASGKVSSVINVHGTWSYAFSDLGTNRTLTITDPQGHQRVVTSSLTTGLIASDRDESGKVTSYLYDTSGRLLRKTEPEGNYVQISYDTRGNITEQRSVAKPGSGVGDIVTSSSYSTTCSNAVTCNRPLSITDSMGRVTDYTYDPNHGGQLTMTLPAAAAGGIRPQTRFNYSALQAYYHQGAGIAQSGLPIWLLTEESKCTNGASCIGTADEVRKSFTYGPQTAGTGNNLLLTTSSESAGNLSLVATTTSTYDIFGNLVAVDGPLPGGADTTNFRYDGARQQVRMIAPDPDGVGPRMPLAKRFSYDLAGRLTLTEVGVVPSAADADWPAFSPSEADVTSYDVDGHRVKEILTGGAYEATVKQFSYDSEGRLECSTIRMNPAEYAALPSSACALGIVGSFGSDRIKKNIYDAAGRIEKIQVAYGTSDQTDEISYTYSSNGMVSSVSDSENNKTTYNYDGHDRLIKIFYPAYLKGSGSSNSMDYDEFSYDYSGNVISHKLRDGATIGYSYDNLDRIISTDMPGSEPDTNVSYDLLGRATFISSGGGQELTNSYDALGRLLSAVQPFGTLSYSYDAAGRRTSMVYPGGGLTINYDYDTTGNVTAIRENGATSGVGVLAAYTYDSLGRRSSVTFGNGSVQSLGYDAVSRLNTLTNNLGGSATTHDFTQAFGYNPAGQIASVTRSNDVYAWQAHYNVDRSYVADGLNRIASAAGLGFSYDARGNLTHDGSKSYAYTSDNLLKATSDGVSLYYDPIGRLTEYDTSISTRYVYDGLDLLAEVNNPAGAIQRRYVHGPGIDNPIVWYEGSAISNSTRRFLMADERGSVVSVTDSAGATIAINAYDEYGIPAPGNAGRFGYTGQTWLPEVGMWYYKARMYSPTLGRFLQTDPMGYTDGLNWYNYVGSDPVNSNDPSGMEAAIVVRTTPWKSADSVCLAFGCSTNWFGRQDDPLKGRDNKASPKKPKNLPGPCKNNAYECLPVPPPEYPNWQPALPDPNPPPFTRKDFCTLVEAFGFGVGGASTAGTLLKWAGKNAVGKTITAATEGAGAVGYLAGAACAMAPK